MDELITNYNKGLLPHRALRLVLLIIIGVNITMAIVATLTYPPLLTMPNSYSYMLELAAMLLLYIFIVMWATRPSIIISQSKKAIFFGAMAGLLEIVHISIENFGHLAPRAETVYTGIFMTGLFFLFGVSGYRIAGDQRNVISGMLGASWSAVICMLLVITYGLSLLFWSFRAIEKHNIGNPDFIRTGWTDMHAFVIADIFEACFKVLFLGPVAGIIFGLLGAIIAHVLIGKRIQV